MLAQIMDQGAQGLLQNRVREMCDSFTSAFVDLFASGCIPSDDDLQDILEGRERYERALAVAQLQSVQLLSGRGEDDVCAAVCLFVHAD
jgi:hypothetical protein